MKNSNPVSPVILEGAPVELIMSNSGITNSGIYNQTGTLVSIIKTFQINPDTSNFAITSTENYTKVIRLLKPVSDSYTRRLLAKNGCMVTFYAKSISGGAVSIQFESFEDITKAVSPVTSISLTAGEYITFVFVRDAWRLMTEISPSSISSPTSLTITGNAADSLNFSEVGGGITFNNATTGNVISGGGNISLAGNIVGANLIGTSSVVATNINVVGSYLETLETNDIIFSESDTNVTLSQVNTKTKIIRVRTPTSNTSITVTLPSPSSILTASTGSGFYTPIVNTTFYFSVINTSTGTGTITIGANGADDVGSRVLTAQTSAVFGYRFTNVTSGSVLATLYRMS
jgi:hypothetical protein